MPPLEFGRYLVDYLFEIGPTLIAGMGSAPITHGEIAAWQCNTGIALTSWEARVVKRLSIEYLNQSHKAQKRDCPPPWAAVDLQPVVSDTQAALRALARL